MDDSWHTHELIIILSIQQITAQFLIFKKINDLNMIITNNILKKEI